MLCRASPLPVSRRAFLRLQTQHRSLEPVTTDHPTLSQEDSGSPKLWGNGTPRRAIRYQSPRGLSSQERSTARCTQAHTAHTCRFDTRGNMSFQALHTCAHVCSLHVLCVLDEPCLHTCAGSTRMRAHAFSTHRPTCSARSTDMCAHMYVLCTRGCVLYTQAHVCMCRNSLHITGIHVPTHASPHTHKLPGPICCPHPPQPGGHWGQEAGTMARRGWGSPANAKESPER